MWVSGTGNVPRSLIRQNVVGVNTSYYSLALRCTTGYYTLTKVYNSIRSRLHLVENILYWPKSTSTVSNCENNTFTSVDGMAPRLYASFSLAGHWPSLIAVVYFPSSTLLTKVILINKGVGHYCFASLINENYFAYQDSDRLVHGLFHCSFVRLGYKHGSDVDLG